MRPISNFKFHVITSGKDDLNAAIKFIFEKPTPTYKGDLVKSWSIENDWFILHWFEYDTTNPFPVALDAASIIGVIDSWLQAHEPNDPLPDIDGSFSIGFEIVANHEKFQNYELFRVRSAWMVHHK